MLTLLISLLSTSGFGSILGAAGGLVNRFLDLKYKAQENEFQLQKLDKEREFMKDEYQARLDIATKETEGRVEEAGYDAMAASYSFAAPTSKDGIIDKISKIIRPLLTVAFFIFTIVVFYKINALVIEMKTSLDAKEVISLWKMCIEWIFFQAGVAIGWWFAMRPGQSPNFKGK